MYKYSKRLFISLFISSTFFISCSQVVNAIPLSPDKYYVDINNRAPVNQTLTVYAREEYVNVREVFIYVIGMRKVGELHDREFYTPDANNREDVANWIKLDVTRAALVPGQELKIPWTVTVPAGVNVACGTGTAAIVVSPTQIEFSTGGTNVALNQQTVSQVHVNINQTNGVPCANRSSQLNVVEFRVNQLLPIFDRSDVPFLTRIENSGNYISRIPKGYIDIFGFGGKATIHFNSENLDIYPQSIRKFDDRWEDTSFPKNEGFFAQLFWEIRNFRIGQYEARLGITRNVDKDIVASTYFWVIPWRTLLVVTVIVGGYIFINRQLKSQKNKKRK
jgi:hypothetical protein